MGAIHGDHVGQATHPIAAVPIGRDPHATGRVDIIGGVAAIGDGNLVGSCRRTPQADRHRARRRVCHGQAFAALAVLRGGWRDQGSEQGENGGNTAQHDRPLKQSIDCIAEW